MRLTLGLALIFLATGFSLADTPNTSSVTHTGCPSAEQVARGFPVPVNCSFSDGVDPVYKSRQELQWLLALLDPRDLFVDHLLHLFEGLGPDLEAVVDQEGRGRSDAEGLAP